MLRQCAWCLRLIDCAGERVSVQPLPKLYEASHGMCGVCGILWMEQVLDSLSPQASSSHLCDRSGACVSQDASSLNCNVGSSIQQQKGEIASMAVRESTNSYSSRSMYSFSEEPEPALEDNTSVPDLS